MSDASANLSSATGCDQHRHDSRRDRFRTALLSAPGVTLVIATLVLPFLWLTVLSFTGDHGPTLAHYTRLLALPHPRTLLTTFELALWVTLFCALIGYPLAYFMAQLSPRGGALAVMFVLLPFWTAILVRTYAWMVLLQRRGVVNSVLLQLGWIDEPLRLVNNMLGTTIGLVHVLVPFLVLPLYAAMRTVDPAIVRAAASLGASPVRAFWTTFFPLTLPSLVGGVLMVFVLCLGSYVTPAILGGGTLVVWPQSIANAVDVYSNWGLAGAMGVVLLAMTIGLIAFSTMVLKVDVLSGRRK